MSEKPRRWLQIHLSTAIVLMFVAGGLLWLNLGQSRLVSYSRCLESYVNENDRRIRVAPDFYLEFTSGGWPFSRKIELEVFEEHENGKQVFSVSEFHTTPRFVGTFSQMPEKVGNVQELIESWRSGPRVSLLNICFGLFALGCATVLCELFVRRKRRTKAA